MGLTSTVCFADTIFSEEAPKREIDVTSPGSFEDVVELLVPELQRMGVYWSDYTVPGRTARENLHGKRGETLLAQEHPGAKFLWNAASPPSPPPIAAKVESAKVCGTTLT
jgi:hypothetical protein